MKQKQLYILKMKASKIYKINEFYTKNGENQIKNVKFQTKMPPIVKNNFFWKSNC